MCYLYLTLVKNSVEASIQVVISFSTGYSARNLGLKEIPDDIPTNADLVFVTGNPIHHIYTCWNISKPLGLFLARSQ